MKLHPGRIKLHLFQVKLHLPRVKPYLDRMKPSPSRMDFVPARIERPVPRMKPCEKGVQSRLTRGLVDQGWRFASESEAATAWYSPPFPENNPIQLNPVCCLPWRSARHRRVK
jgi:hypothetical protein